MIKTGNFEEGIYFKIDRVQGKLENESFDAKKNQKMAQAMIDCQTYSQYPKPNRVEEDRDIQTLLDIFSEEIESQQDQDFFQDDKDVQKKKKKKKTKGKVKFKIQQYHS